MRILKGIGASAGIGVGPAFLYRHEKLIIPHTYLPSSQKEREKTRFQHAIKSVETELKKMGNQTSSSDHKAILETYLLMLSDPDFISNVESQIEKNQVSAERAVDNVVSNLIATLESVKDVSIKERSADIFDVGQRIIRTLMGKRKADLTSIVGQVVLVAETLLPSEALLLDPEKVITTPIDEALKEGAISIFPKGTKLIGLTLSNQIAFVDFTKEFTNKNIWDEDLSFRIALIRKNLINQTTIRDVVILIEGEIFDKR